MEQLNKKEDELKEILNSLGTVAVGFSGGVDSGFLFLYAAKVLGKNKVVGITVKTGFLKQSEISFIRKFSGEYNLKNIIINADFMPLEDAKKEGHKICYECKKFIFENVRKEASFLKIDNICDGTNYDDIFKDRPGLKALKELKVVSPLADAGITKEDVCRLLKKYSFKLLIGKAPYSCLAMEYDKK